MRTFNIVIERDPDTNMYVGYVPGWPGAHSQGETLDELRRNLQEVLGMLSRTVSRSSNPSSSVFRRSRSHSGRVAASSQAARGCGAP